MRPMLAGGVGIVVLLAMIGYASMQKAQYSATSQLYEMPTAVKLLSTGTSGNLDEGQYETFLAEQMLLVTRPDVLKAALDSVSPDNWTEYGGTEPAAAENLTALLKVARVGTSHQVSISLKGSDPVKTATLVNAIAAAYIDAARKATTAESDQRGQLLAEERQRIDSELQADRAEQISLGASMGVANPTVGGGNPYDAGLSEIRVQLSEARAAHEVAAAQLASLSGIGAGGTSGLMAAADEQILGDAGLGSMKASISQRKAVLTAQMAGMTPTNPVYKQDQDEIADLDRTLDKMTVDLRDKAARRLQDKLHADLQRTGDVESRLNGQLAREIASATSAAPRLQRATEVEADIQRLGVRLASVDDAIRSLRLEVSGPAQVRLSLPATPAEHPEANRRKQLLLLALPLAIFFGIGAAVLARIRDKRIFMGLDVVDLLGFAPLAVLPARGDVSQRVFEEYVLRLAAGIESAYRTSGARTFLLTAVSLTTDIRPLASALTRKFEEIGVNVVVATASEMLTPTEGSQATAATTDGMDPVEMTRVVELWSEGFVAANVAKMKAEHGLVLIESEALLNCAQTEYVARCADATILVIECSVTTRQELTQATDLLHRLNVTRIAAVLEEVQLRHADSAFRAAIDALDRRQAEVRPTERVVRMPQTVATMTPEATSVPEPVVEMAEPVAPKAAPLPLAQALEMMSASPVQEKLLEAEGDRVELEYEPSHYHEVLHHVRETRPFEHDSDWHLPAFGQVPPAPAAESPEPVVATPRWLDSGAFESVSEPALPQMEPVVENRSHIGLSAVENMADAAAIDVASRSLHEKIAPKLSARRDEATSDGDSSMTRKSSWFDKLLRRDSEAAVSIVPTDDDDDETDVRVNAPVSLPPARTVDLHQAVARTGTASEEYDVPLATRIDQISRQRPAFSGSPMFGLGSSGTRPASRLQIVPPEPVGEEIDEESPTTAESVEIVHAVGPTEEPIVEQVAAAAEAAEPATEHVAELHLQTAPAEAVPELSVAEAIAAPEVAEAPKPRGPRRPLSFHELAGRVEKHEVVPVVLASVEPSLPEPAKCGDVVESTVAEHVPVSAQVPDFTHPAAEAAHEPIFEQFAEVTAETVHTPVESTPEPEFVHAIEDHFVAEAETYRPSSYEVDDIEPVYQEASRNLNNSRWDPIPTLRPSGIWRDRPSPVPVNGNGVGRKYAHGAVQDGFNSAPPRRWIPEEEPVMVEEPEPVSEPVLSRQWGLLSRFQQARLVSSHESDEGSRDHGQGYDDPGSTHGNSR
jgi:uncharacterized protein involved in exopolysaccharide biosynthesis